MKCSRIARGFGCGSSSGFVAEVRPKAGLGFRVEASFAVSAIHFVYQSECGDQPQHLGHCVEVRWNIRDASGGRDFGNLRVVGDERYSIGSRSRMRNIPVMNSIPDVRSSIPWIAAIVSAVGIAAICVRAFETDEARAKSAEHKRGKEIRSMADKISEYAHGVHQRYPTGDVVVSVRDLAEQLGKRPDAVANALNLLLREQKVQQAPLRDYWKLNV
jgi:hypothetical protein